MDVFFSMSWFFKNRLNALNMNSPLLFDQNTLILYSDCVSTKALNSLILSIHSYLNFNTYNHTFLKKSSMKVTKYLAPPMDIIFIGLHMSKFTIFNGLVACLPPRTETQHVVVCLQCTLCKTTRMWGKKICQVSCHSPCFRAYEHSSRSNGRGIGTPSPVGHCTKLAASTPSIIVKFYFIQVVFVWHNCNDFAVASFYKTFA